MFVCLCAGDRWRINFSRVHYNVTWDDQQQRYIKDPADQPGYNFVWSPQWQVQMHQPETWGYLQFSSTPGEPHQVKLKAVKPSTVHLPAGACSHQRPTEHTCMGDPSQGKCHDSRTS